MPVPTLNAVVGASTDDDGEAAEFCIENLNEALAGSWPTLSAAAVSGWFELESDQLALDIYTLHIDLCIKIRAGLCLKHFFYDVNRGTKSQPCGLVCDWQNSFVTDSTLINSSQLNRFLNQRSIIYATVSSTVLLSTVITQ